MKTIKRLNFQDKLVYFFKNMRNINDFNPELLSIDDFAIFKDGSMMFDIVFCEENTVPHIVFNSIECIFIKSGVFSYLIFCESDKNKKMLDKYIKVIDKIKEEMLLLTIDEYKIGDDLFVMGKDFTRFKFKSDDKLVYNQKINVPVCVISISSVFERGGWYYPQTELQDCFYESDYLDEN